VKLIVLKTHFSKFSPKVHIFFHSLKNTACAQFCGFSPTLMFVSAYRMHHKQMIKKGIGNGKNKKYGRRSNKYS
jgi:hypothetical protein